MSSASDQPSQLIVYACPLGPLAAQIERYYAASQAACGTNAAHSYMPHCSLTGFFHDDRESVGIYIAALDTALHRARPTQPLPALTIGELTLRPEFHGLLLRSPWLQRLIADFAHTAHSPTRRDPLRLKDWLHLSLAYAFPPHHHAPLAMLARDMVDISAPVSWELRLYERHLNAAWTCHARWALS
ncbi:MAG: hypothetical protein ABIV47_22750 [Roseiflexaceae bacterium]